MVFYLLRDASPWFCVVVMLGVAETRSMYGLRMQQTQVDGRVIWERDRQWVGAHEYQYNVLKGARTLRREFTRAARL